MSLSLTADLCEKSSLDIQPKSDVKPKKLQLSAVTLQVKNFGSFRAFCLNVYVCGSHTKLIVP